MTSWECPNYEHMPASVHDTQLYQPTTVAGGYESDSSWDLNPDGGTDDDSIDMPESEVESEDDDAPVVVRRKPKASGGSTGRDCAASMGRDSPILFADVGRRFTGVLKAAHMPM